MRLLFCLTFRFVYQQNKVQVRFQDEGRGHRMGSQVTGCRKTRTRDFHVLIQRPYPSNHSRSNLVSVYLIRPDVQLTFLNPNTVCEDSYRLAECAVRRLIECVYTTDSESMFAVFYEFQAHRSKWDRVWMLSVICGPIIDTDTWFALFKIIDHQVGSVPR